MKAEPRTRAAAVLIGIAILTATPAVGAPARQAVDASQAAAAAPQAPGIRGTVVGPDGGPIAGVEVMLHRMTDSTGGVIARQSTDPAGRFGFALGDRQGAVHFAAASRDGVLYVGPVLAPEAPLPADYEIRVTGDAEAGSIVLEDGTVMPPAAFSGTMVQSPPAPGGGTRDSRRTALVFLGLASILGAAALFWRDRARARAWRAAILELAELNGAPETETAKRERVAELRERAHALRPR